MDDPGTVRGASQFRRLNRENHRRGRIHLDDAIPESDARRPRGTDSICTRVRLSEKNHKVTPSESVSSVRVRRENAGD